LKKKNVKVQKEGQNSKESKIKKRVKRSYEGALHREEVQKRKKEETEKILGGREAE